MEIIPIEQKVQDIAGADRRNRLRAVGQTLYEEWSPRGMEPIATPKLEGLCEMKRDDTGQKRGDDHDLTTATIHNNLIIASSGGPTISPVIRIIMARLSEIAEAGP
jgi:hypothetical protein